MNNLIEISLKNETGEKIEFHLNPEELEEFINSKIFMAMIDDLIQISFKK